MSHLMECAGDEKGDKDEYNMGRRSRDTGNLACNLSEY
jgi:hypothetical protein